ncbi:MAG TPA: hypothetical protein VNL70_02650 [Tepidisphaeraceae bacterium]|nr:hypothetical protein [Tepidisphaeraceae bacterium]
MLRRFLSFRTRHQPYMVRLSYRHELRSALTFPLAASLAEGSFTGIIAAKHFQASVLLMSVITAAPMFGNIMAMVWSELSIGRRKVPFVNLLQLGVILMVASVALTAMVPRELTLWHMGGRAVTINAAGWVFAAQIVIARMLASGIITIRSQIWRANYPRWVRAQVTSRIAVVATTVLAVTTFAGSYILDQNPRAYVYLYPIAALIGAIGIWQFSKIRVRREALLLRREEQLYAPRPEGLSQTDETNVLNYQARAPRVSLLTFFIQSFQQAGQILRQDKAFRDYQRWQFFSGFSFMLYGPSLLYMVSTQMTDPSKDYLLATVVLQLVPMVVSLVATQAWAPLFDRVHVVLFRVYQSYISVAGQLTLFLGAIWAWKLGGSERTGLAIITLGQILVGISTGAGNLAWNLGHNDFAPRDQAAVYMGVHVMLTGVRGCLAPFLGSWLFEHLLGRHVFLLSTLICTVAMFGFMSMARATPNKFFTKPVARPLPHTPG